METVLTIRLPKSLAVQISRLAKRRGVPQSAVVREALRREFLRSEFDDLHTRFMKEATRQGIVSEEQIFDRVS